MSFFSKSGSKARRPLGRSNARGVPCRIERWFESSRRKVGIISEAPWWPYARGQAVASCAGKPRAMPCGRRRRALCPVARNTPFAPPHASSVLRAGRRRMAPQQVVKVRRDYNSWVATETMEDYALRYTPQALSQVVRMAGGQHGVWRGILPDPRGGRHAAGAVRLHQRLLGHRPRGSSSFWRAAHQRVCGAVWGGHGPAHARRGLWLHRLHAHLADLRSFTFHLLCARSRRDGLCAGAGARHPAHLGLPGSAPLW